MADTNEGDITPEEMGVVTTKKAEEKAAEIKPDQQADEITAIADLGTDQTGDSSARQSAAELSAPQSELTAEDRMRIGGERGRLAQKLEKEGAIRTEDGKLEMTGDQIAEARGEMEAAENKATFDRWIGQKVREKTDKAISMSPGDELRESEHYPQTADQALGEYLNDLESAVGKEDVDKYLGEPIQEAREAQIQVEKTNQEMDELRNLMDKKAEQLGIEQSILQKKVGEVVNGGFDLLSEIKGRGKEVLRKAKKALTGTIRALSFVAFAGFTIGAMGIEAGVRKAKKVAKAGKKVIEDVSYPVIDPITDTRDKITSDVKYAGKNIANAVRQADKALKTTAGETKDFAKGHKGYRESFQNIQAETASDAEQYELDRLERKLHSERITPKNEKAMGRLKLKAERENKRYGGKVFGGARSKGLAKRNAKFGKTLQEYNQLAGNVVPEATPEPAAQVNTTPEANKLSEADELRILQNSKARRERKKTPSKSRTGVIQSMT